MITVGDTVNGRWVVLAVAARRGDLDTLEGDNGGDATESIILAKAADDGEYVTARMRSDRRSWYWGNYFSSASAERAWRDFIDRIEVLDTASVSG